MFLPEFGYTVTENDPDQPWIVLGSSRGQVTVPDDSRSSSGRRCTGRRQVERPARSMATRAEVVSDHDAIVCLSKLRRENFELRRSNEISTSASPAFRAAARSRPAEMSRLVDEWRARFGIEAISGPAGVTPAYFASR
jgi:hypothetical protein